MRQRKHHRELKRQAGQYMTPDWLARQIVSDIRLDGCNRILEPSCGDGAFLSAIANRITGNDLSQSSQGVELLGIEVDSHLAHQARSLMENKSAQAEGCFQWEVREADFFRDYLSGVANSWATDRTGTLMKESFDLIIGNPPFGGTFDHSIEDSLDKILGKRLGKKIKKETYAFFIVASLDLLKPSGQLVFVCSNTILTIPTMTGLRKLLMEHGEVTLSDIQEFSNETSYPMLVLKFRKGGQTGRVLRNSRQIDNKFINATPNLSWGITDKFAKFFAGPLLGDYFVASSGMTTGKNEFFVRQVDESQRIVEPYRFEFYDAPVTVNYELERARLGKLPVKRRQLLEESEARGDVERRVRILPLDNPLTVSIPDDRYRPYNKANNHLVFSNPTHYIFWEDDGDAVLTYKKTGNWYLRGVGGQPYFGREGLTWQLIASRFVSRYIPEGYILDSGAPCAFLREGVSRQELFFTLGWLLSPLANRILKTVINHTQNIQSKDFERMPYPWWVNSYDRCVIIKLVEDMIAEAREGRVWQWNDAKIQQLGELFEPGTEFGESPPESNQVRPHSIERPASGFGLMN